MPAELEPHGDQPPVVPAGHSCGPSGQVTGPSGPPVEPLIEDVSIDGMCGVY